jgi:hypothetical protein
MVWIQGFAAQKAGLDISENPYKIWTLTWKEWRAGFLDARD